MRERIHVITVWNDRLTITAVTKPTTLPVEHLEADLLLEHPDCTLKATKSFPPEQFEAVEAEADERGIGVDDLLDEWQFEALLRQLKGGHPTS